MRNVVRTLVVSGAIAVASVPSAAARADRSMPPQPSGAPSLAAPTSPPAPTQAQQKAKSEEGGIVQLVDEALSKVNLRKDQTEALQQVGADVDEKVGDVDQAKREMLRDLAQQIESGSIDESVLQPKIGEVADAAAAAESVLRRAFEKVHDVLDADQREQFVSALRDALKSRESKYNTKSMVDELSSTLTLSDEQKQKITSIFDNKTDTVARDIARARMQLILAAFPGDTFSMDELIPAGLAREHTGKMLRRVVRVAEEVNAVLTPEQRAKAAKAVRDRIPEQPAGGSHPGAASDVGESTGGTSQPLWVGGGGYGPGYGGGYGPGYGDGYGPGYGGGYGGYGGYGGGYGGYGGGYGASYGSSSGTSSGYRSSAVYQSSSGYGIAPGYGPYGSYFF